jgi:hypothetical protein
MKELSTFKGINLLKCCDVGSRMTQFGLPRDNTTNGRMTVHNGLEKMRRKIPSHNISEIEQILREISVGQQDLRFPVQGMFMSLFPGL